MAERRYLLTFLSGLAEDLNLARRRYPYEVLVLLARPEQLGMAEDIAAAERNIAGPDACLVVSLPPDDVYGTVDRLRTILDGFATTGQIMLNLAGANPAHVAASMVLAFERGMTTVMCQHDHVSTLPILAGMTLKDRFDETERRVLRRLRPDPASVADLAQHLLVPKPRVHKACRGLVNKGMVELSTKHGATYARLNQHGLRMREHVEEAEAPSPRQGPKVARTSRSGQAHMPAEREPELEIT